MSALRQAVIAEARTWIGTPWAHMADVKGAGVDCAMLVRRSFMHAGACEPFDPRPYPYAWFLHKDEERFLAWAHQLATEVTEPRPGDVGIWKFGRCYSHAGIIIDHQTLIHAFVKNGWVAEDPRFSGALTHRPVKYFDVIGDR